MKNLEASKELVSPRFKDTEEVIDDYANGIKKAYQSVSARVMRNQKPTSSVPAGHQDPAVTVRDLDTGDTEGSVRRPAFTITSDRLMLNSWVKPGTSKGS